MKRISLIFCIAILLSLSVGTFAQQRPANIKGTVQDGIYKNQVLGFEVRIPAGWYVASPEEQDAVLEAGQRDAKAAGVRVTNDDVINFVISKKPLGATENPVIGLGLNKQSSELITPKMIAEATKLQFLSIPSYSLSDDISYVTISNHQFATFNLAVDPKTSTQHVQSYITMVKNYSLAFVFTYMNSDDLKLMRDAMKTIKFEK